LRRETLATRAGYEPRAHHGAVKPPVYMTSTFVYESAQHAKHVHEGYFDHTTLPEGQRAGYIYARLDHPNMAMLQQRVAALDGAEDAAVFNSGLAALNTVFHAFLRPGDTVLHSMPLYGGTDALLRTHFGNMGVTAVGIPDALDRDTVFATAAHAMRQGPVGLIHIETPANPTSGIADIALAVAAADDIGARQGRRPPVLVDNTFLGPMVQNPLGQGADLCMTSLTKYAGGHSDLLGGGVSGRAALIEPIRQLRTIFGTHMDPHTCWMLLRSLESLPVRGERAARSAAAIAAFLSGHPKVASIVYLGFLPEGSAARAVYDRQCQGAGSTFSFRVKGGEAEAFRMLDALRVIRMAVSLGGTETLICHSASTTHYAVPAERRLQMGVDDATLRISIGIEHADDLIEDLAQALDAI
jgi:cystathionine gamma-synthase/methionine-gamma-lyase